MKEKRAIEIGIVKGIKHKNKYTDLIVQPIAGEQINVIRVFNDFRNVEIGDTIIAVGRVKAFKDTVYFSPQYLTLIKDDSLNLWEEILSNTYKPIEISIKKGSETKEKDVASNMPKEKVEIKEQVSTKHRELEKISDRSKLRSLILKLVEELDLGEGVSIEDLVKELGEDKRKNIEEIIEELLLRGEVYEASLGKIKLLK